MRSVWPARSLFCEPHAFLPVFLSKAMTLPSLLPTSTSNQSPYNNGDEVYT